VLNAILWILRTGAPWRDLPHRYPPYQTCHRRFKNWVREGVLESVLATLARHLRERGDLDLSECFIDATFVAASSHRDAAALGVPRGLRDDVDDAIDGVGALAYVMAYVKGGGR
jgi:transposase